MKVLRGMRTATFRRLPALALVLAGGCLTSGPDYHPPTVSVPANWNAQVAKTAGAAPRDAPALDHWCLVFRDPVLGDLVATARTNNLDLKQAEARVRQARAQRNLSRADQLPTMTASASASRTRSGGQQGAGIYSSSFAGGLDATWELDLFGGRRREVESAEASLQASQEAWRDVMVSLLAEVALNYVQYRSCQARLAITETNLAAQTETHAITRWRQQANLVTQLDVDQARVILEQTRAELPALHTSLDQAEHQLATLLGVAPGSLKSRLDAGPAVVPVAEASIAVGVPADVLRQRPDVREAERRLAAQTAQIGVAAATRYPDLSLHGSIGVEALHVADLHTAGARTAQGLLQAAWTAFDGGRIREKVNVQTALQEECLAAYQAAVLTALKDVEDALVAYANESTRQQALREAATAGESAFRLARDKYAAGLVDFQTVLSTQQSLLAVQTTLASSRADEASDLIRLYKALGGGWTPEAPRDGGNL